MIAAALIFVGIAAVIHVGIFYMESIAWTGPRVRAIFKTTEEEARTTRLLALNQGFYNLFLAVAVMLGIAMVALGTVTIGATLIFAGAGSMALAALVLLLSSPGRALAAATQGLLPAVGVILLGFGLALQ